MKAKITTRYNEAVAIERGPLVYALKIAETWTRVNADKPHRELPHGDFEVRPAGAWNYGLVIDEERAGEGVRFEERPVGEQPFSPDGAGMIARATGRKIPSWKLAARLGRRDLARRRGVVRPGEKRLRRARRGGDAHPVRMHEHPGHRVPEATAAAEDVGAAGCVIMAGMAGRRTLPLQTIALAVSIAAAACGGDSTTPTSPTPPTSQLTIACPAARTATSLQSQPATVTWTAPTTSGGTAPVYVACTPASGASFSVGSTTVACTATGSAASETASCSFTVTVTRPPQISVTRFMAFGDSITWGTRRAGRRVPPVQDPPPSYSYPSQLLAMLGGRYLDQSITVANEGWPGEWIADGLGRLPDADGLQRAGGRAAAGRRKRPVEQSDQRDDPVHRVEAAGHGADGEGRSPGEPCAPRRRSRPSGTGRCRTIAAPARTSCPS